MGLSSKSREIVRLENIRATAELQKESRKDIDRIRATMPRGGGMNAAVDSRQVQCLRESFVALTDSYIRAFEREGVDLTMYDIDEITSQMKSQVDALFRSRMELEPRSVGTGFHQQLEAIVGEQRISLVLAMKKMELEHSFPTKPATEAKTVFNVSGANARVNINSTDTSVNVVTINTQQLFANIRSTIGSQISSAERREALARCVDELEAAQGTAVFLERYQRFIAALADHITIFQAFLPALSQLIS